MRFPLAFCSVAAIGFAASFPVLAQTAKPPAKGSSTAETRYFSNLGDILGDLPVDAFIKETVQDGKIVSTTLDACYSVALTSDRKDRFVVELKSDGQKLTGSGETTENKFAVIVNLTRKGLKNGVTFDGKITIGDRPSLVSSTDNSESDEKEFQASQATDDNLTEKPADFTEVSPQSLAIKVKRENFVDLIKSLRADNVQLSLDSLATDCAALRTGAQLVRVTVDPARAGALVDKLKSSPGVIDAGWTTGDYDIERSILVPAAEWRDGDKLNRDKLAGAISNSLAKALSAQPVSTKWNDTTGELTVSVKRPNTAVPALNLTDTLEVSAMIGPEKPGASDRLIVWLGTTSITTSDETQGPHLTFSDDSSNDEGESAFTDDDGLVRALTADLKGKQWDAERAKWKQ
ncbi:MAG: hypothetical protein K2W78_02795 [Xanthobacteraceae bacterium]|nr:hypothetical protein [Xanthobacteraceae bacterium]